MPPTLRGVSKAGFITQSLPQNQAQLPGEKNINEALGHVKSFGKTPRVDPQDGTN